MSGVPISWYLTLSAVLFCVGTVGALTRRNGFTIFLSIELMLNSVNLSVLAYARVAAAEHGVLAALDGKILVLFVLAVAAAEAAVGLALFIAVYRNRRETDINRMNLLRW